MASRNPRDYRDLLRTGRWFAALPAELAEALVDAAALRRLAAGERLFSRGDAPCGLYGIVDGGVRISGSSDAGREVLLTLLEPPQWFGEISVFDGQPRTHDAVAESETLLVHVPQPALDRILAAEPRWWRDLALLATSKLRLAFLAMEDAALLPVAVRVARRLALMSEGYGERRLQLRTVAVTQEQLASMLSISRQTANQHLKELEARGLIKLAYHEIEIVDLPALKRAGSLD